MCSPKEWNSNIFLHKNLFQHKKAKNSQKAKQFFEASQLEMRPKKGQKAN